MKLQPLLPIPQNFILHAFVFTHYLSSPRSCGELILLPIRVLGLFDQSKLMRLDEKFRQGFIGSSIVAGGSKDKQLTPLLTHDVGWADPSNGMWVRAGLGSGQRGDLGGVPTHLVLCTGCIDFYFSLCSSEVAVRFLVFLYLIFHKSPNWACIQLFLVPYSVFVFSCWRRQQRVLDPSLYQSDWS